MAATRGEVLRMKPSDVDLSASFPPLVGTMGKAEAEATAAVIVLALAANGDEWRPIAWPQVRDHFAHLLDQGIEPWAKLAVNPFWRPELGPLLREQVDATGFRFNYAVEEPAGADKPWYCMVSFTFAGLLALSKHRRVGERAQRKGAS